ncbi:uncharacterized protein M421DRAFT_4882 [Didymella exigua CBS 183.55]|uniref:Casein kinase substrate phosphoprotein PP28 domain-containing protein n=1 Tax=Didymella exigua CBS 183.55 TaxID=1150837 RepID=A0A6A5RPJ6_9PLEO|nr:uncharacterized protein M421DRAFT_4882 [Didymella exigua CBS 183.55]KAF1929068.1 hypothetical protein M421DRAFT_4882 [Didymella exigua CBS 183.55]
MSSARGRGGKFNKAKRGGGKHFSRDLQPLNAEGEVMGMWGEQPEKVDRESSDEDSSEEESSEDEDGEPKQQEELTREQRREQAKARKQAAIAKKNQKVPEAGDLPSSDEESSDDDNMPANPNHTAKARTQAAKAPVDPEAAPAAATAKGKGKQDTSQLSRREREAFEKQQAKERYEKLHAEGKTDQARADLERLKLVRERREGEAARKKAEAEERAELDKEKAELMAREARRREQAMGKANRLAKGGKKK